MMMATPKFLLQKHQKPDGTTDVKGLGFRHDPNGVIDSLNAAYCSTAPAKPSARVE